MEFKRYPMSKRKKLVIIGRNLQSFIFPRLRQFYLHLGKDSVQQNTSKGILARRRHYPVDSVAPSQTEPAHRVTRNLIERDGIHWVLGVCLYCAVDLGRLGSPTVIDDVHAPCPLAAGLDSDVFWLGHSRPLGMVARQHVPDGQRVMKGQALVVALAEHRVNLVKSAIQKGFGPLGKGTALLQQRLDLLVESLLVELVGSSDIQGEQAQLELTGQLLRIGTQDRLAVYCWWHRR
ncbi:hypothetical protein QC762_0010630 [Podospora pseudocomata]|uniref:Uncharacterized protein n=1 Tax=Podospora pseudocomata TaxID=2093779 RepID=A0ABR0GVA2_9PEZI|nr:hypothetical protein QC762_0010630 [Podospora pseudocomata]